MNRFAALLDRLVLTPQRNIKLKLLADYFRETPDPDRGYALAALAGDLSIPGVKPALLRALITERLDPILFGYSYDYVGDLAETIALAWPDADQATAVSEGAAGDRNDSEPQMPLRSAAIGERRSRSLDEIRSGPPLSTGSRPAPSLGEIVDTMMAASRLDAPRLMERWLDNLDATGRWGLIKLVTGGLRVGVSARLAKQAIADLGDKKIDEIEELWHGLEPPYPALFAWLEGRGDRPVSHAPAPFRPAMLAHPIAADGIAAITPDAYAAEWKWDGVRVQAAAEGGVRRLYSRTGEDISRAFPDIIDGLDFDGAIDGEVLIGRPAGDQLDVGSFGDLQQRLNRKTVTTRLLEAYPAFIRAYDCLVDDGNDLRRLSFRDRRDRLEALIGRSHSGRFDLSPLVPFRDADELAMRRADPPDPVIEGLMLKRWDSDYRAGRPKGLWFKWKRDPHIVDAVLMYAQRGHGKRSSYYSDYTFGVWQNANGTEELVPVGKAYFGFTDDELIEIDRFVRNNTTARFGPVREVLHAADAGLVFEVAFDGLNRSTRHKSGVAMRFPRISRLRWDKPPREADRLETLEALLTPAGAHIPTR